MSYEDLRSVDGHEEQKGPRFWSVLLVCVSASLCYQYV